MRAATLRHRITIQQNSPLVDTYGAPSDGWSTFKTVWAEVMPTSGGEMLTAAGEARAQSQYTVTIRYLKGLTSTMRILYRDRVLEIVSINDVDERHRVLQVSCVEVNAQ